MNDTLAEIDTLEIQSPVILVPIVVSVLLFLVVVFTLLYDCRVWPFHRVRPHSPLDQQSIVTVIRRASQGFLVGFSAGFIPSQSTPSIDSEEEEEEEQNEPDRERVEISTHQTG